MESSSSLKSKVSSSGNPPVAVTTGDMVWAKVHGYPWWPGYILDERLALLQARNEKIPGRVLVSFFGDSSYKWFDPAELIPYAPNFAEKSKKSREKKFLQAIEESKEEVRWRASLGLYCPCLEPDRFRPSTTRGYVNVSGWDYSKKLVKNSVKEFSPKESQSFLLGLAKNVKSGEVEDVEFLKMKERLLAFRKWTIPGDDPTYAEAFGVEPEVEAEAESAPRGDEN